jgi:hypothetical protein
MESKKKEFFDSQTFRSEPDLEENPNVGPKKEVPKKIKPEKKEEVEVKINLPNCRFYENKYPGTFFEFLMDNILQRWKNWSWWK